VRHTVLLVLVLWARCTAELDGGCVCRGLRVQLQHRRQLLQLRQWQLAVRLVGWKLVRGEGEGGIADSWCFSLASYNTSTSPPNTGRGTFLADLLQSGVVACIHLAQQ
jgi:hypothetical protein